MKYNEVLNLSDIVGEGFFADRVVELLKERKPLRQRDEKVLGGVLDFIKKAKKGKRQVSSGRLSSDALDSIGAYNRAVSIIAFQAISEDARKKEKKIFDELLGAIESEVKETIKRKTVNPQDLKETLKFFVFVRRQTLSEASKYYSKKVEIISWPSLLY